MQENNTELEQLHKSLNKDFLKTTDFNKTKNECLETSNFFSKRNIDNIPDNVFKESLREALQNTGIIKPDVNYFTPDISELRIGYECEFKDTNQDNVWVKKIININNLNKAVPFAYSNGWIRTPYLTQQQLQDKGWVYKQLMHLFDLYFEKSNYCLLYDLKDYSLQIYKREGRVCIFEGFCKDINTFNYICKLLNIE